MTEYCIITAFTFCTTISITINDGKIISYVICSFFQGGTLGGKKKDRDNKKSVIDIFHKKKVSSISCWVFSYSLYLTLGGVASLIRPVSCHRNGEI